MRGTILLGLAAVVVVALLMSGSLSGAGGAGIGNMNAPKNASGEKAIGYADVVLTMSLIYTDDKQLYPYIAPGPSTQEHIGLGVFGDPKPAGIESRGVLEGAPQTTISITLTASERFGTTIVGATARQTQLMMVALPEPGTSSPDFTIAWGNYYVFSETTTKWLQFEIASTVPMVGGLLPQCYKFVFDGVGGPAESSACPLET